MREGSRLGVVGGSRGSLVATGGLLGVDGGALVGDVSDEAVITVGGVLDMLDPAVGKGNRVRSGNVGGAVRGLLGLEVGLGVVISHGVGEGVGALLSKVISDVSGLHGGVVSGSGVDDRGGVDSVSNDRGGVDGMSDGGVDGVSDGSVDKGSVDGVSDGGVDKGGVDGVSDMLGGDRVEGDDGGLALGDGAVSEH